jgi:hypothetical protein
VDKHAKIELLKDNSFAFDVNLTLDEIEWTRVLGPNGLGNELLHKMVEMGSDLFDLGGADHMHNGDAEVFCFTLDGRDYQLRLAYEQPFIANLQTAVRQILDGINGALRRQAVGFRFICVRDSCTGAGCTYRLMVLPTPWLRELEDELNIVSGLSLEDYEAQRSFHTPPHRPDFGGGPLEAR